jgi:membrane protease YdiL (CAAX protease family)
VDLAAPYEPAGRFGIADVAVGILLFLVVIFSSYPIVWWVPIADPNSFSFWFSLASYAVIVAFLIVVTVRRGQRSFTKDFSLRFRPIDLALGLGIGVLAKILSAVIGVIVFLATGGLPEGGNVQLGDDKLWAALTGILIASLLAPFVEELFFRGFVLTAVRNSVLRKRGAAASKRAVIVAVLVSAAAFAVMHLQPVFDPILLIVLGLSTFTFGVLNALITLHTKRIGAAIVAHTVFNGSSIALLLLFGDQLQGLMP